MKIEGLKKISGETKSLRGCYDPGYLQLNFDIKTGKAWTDYHYDLGHSWETRYHDKNIIKIGNLVEPMKMSEIKEMIEDIISNRK